MTEPLLPCPFCGASPAYGTTDDAVDFVACPDCDLGFANAKLVCPSCEEGKSDAPADAWNRRAPYLPPEDLETLRRIADEIDREWLGPAWHEDIRALIERLTEKP